MGLFKSKKSKKQGFASHLADLAMVASALFALASRLGWVSDSTARRFGASKNASMSISQLFVVAAALYRTWHWLRGKD